MECEDVQKRLVRKIDGELSDSDNNAVNAHLSKCAVCSREYALLALPGRIAPHIPQATPSPYFYQKLQLRINREAQSLAGWQMLWGLARHLIPAMAGITLALLSVLAFLQWQAPQSARFSSYESIFVAQDQPRLLFNAGQGDISDVSILTAIAERPTDYKSSSAE
ncbi:MAG: zf-HC2 domain-containing protein [Acidobacteriota bacterium]|jgi:anti-sigma factor RsiW|nr:zf-HC2 domain-containing protein [Acidobacteriota bacterium]